MTHQRDPPHKSQNIGPTSLQGDLPAILSFRNPDYKAHVMIALCHMQPNN